MADYCVSSILPKLLLDPTPPTYVYSAADAAKFTTYTVLFRNGSCFETRNLPCQKIANLLWIFHTSRRMTISLFCVSFFFLFLPTKNFVKKKISVETNKFRANATDIQNVTNSSIPRLFPLDAYFPFFFSFSFTLHYAFTQSKFKYQKRINEPSIQL